MRRNDELFHRSQDWLRDALVWLQQPHVYTKAHDEMARLGLDATGVRSCKFSIVQQVDELLELPATEALFTCLIKVREAVNIPTEPEQGVRSLTEAWTPRSLAIRFLNLYLDRTQSLQFHLDVVEGLYSDLEQLLYDAETIEIIGMIEFENAEFEIDDGEIAHGVRFRRVAETELSPRKWFVFGEPFRELPEVVLEVKTKFTGNDATLDSPLSSANRQQIEDAANAVLLALRLIRSQPICLYALRFSITNAFLDHVESSLPSDYGSCGRPGGLYKVTSEVVDEVRMLWPQAKKAIHEIATDSEWSLAVTRFGDAYRRTKGDDQLVDYWIALETLFLPEERAPEKGVAAGLAISNYLGESSADRRSLYASVKKSYTLRSRVVHGKTGTRDRDFDLEIDKTAELLRRSMLKRVREL